MILALAVFLTDAGISWLSGKFWDSRTARNLKRALVYGAALDAAIGINAMGFVSEHWIMLLPSVLGGTLGIVLGWDFKRSPPTFK